MSATRKSKSGSKPKRTSISQKKSTTKQKRKISYDSDEEPTSKRAKRYEEKKEEYYMIGPITMLIVLLKLIYIGKIVLNGSIGITWEAIWLIWVFG